MTVAAYVVIPVIALFGIPAVITLAILKYGLYQIDVIINRAVQYGLLSATLTARVCRNRGGHRDAGRLQPAARCSRSRRPWRSRCCSSRCASRAQLVANRLVYGERATPYQVLADFAEDMAGQLDFDTALDRMASMLAGATGAVRVEVWIRVGAQLRPQVTWPRGSAPPAAVPLAGDAELPAFELAAPGRSGPARR